MYTEPLMDELNGETTLRNGEMVEKSSAMAVMLELLEEVYHCFPMSGEQLLAALLSAARLDPDSDKPMPELPLQVDKESFETFADPITGRFHNPVAREVILSGVVARQSGGKEKIVLISPFASQDMDRLYAQMRVEALNSFGIKVNLAPADHDVGMPSSLLADAEEEDFNTGKTIRLTTGVDVPKRQAEKLLHTLDSDVVGAMLHVGGHRFVIIELVEFSEGRAQLSPDRLAQFMCVGKAGADGEVNPVLLDLLKAALRWRDTDAMPVLVNPANDPAELNEFLKERDWFWKWQSSPGGRYQNLEIPPCFVPDSDLSASPPFREIEAYRRHCASQEGPGRQ